MAPYYGPDEDAATIFLERTFIAGDFICGVGYGVQLVLYVTCFRYLWGTRKGRPQSVWLLAYITTLLCVETIFEAVQARTVQAVYIDNRNYPGGPWEYFLATQNLPINVLFIAMLFISTFLADMLVLWRCWVIWTASGKRTAYLITAFPTLMLLASFAMGTLWTLQSSQPGLSLYSKLPVAILITIRLLMHRKKILATLPEDHARHYISLATIIIESAALYSVFAQIANYLIIYRLAEGKAWGKDTLAQYTSMKFGGTRQITTMTTTEIGTIRINDVENVENGGLNAVGGKYKWSGPDSKVSGSSTTAL